MVSSANNNFLIFTLPDKFKQNLIYSNYLMRSLGHKKNSNLKKLFCLEIRDSITNGINLELVHYFPQ